MAIKCASCKKEKNEQQFRGGKIICQNCTGASSYYKEKLVALIYKLSNDLNVKSIDTNFGIVKIFETDQNEFEIKYPLKKLHEIADTLIVLEDELMLENSTNDNSNDDNKETSLLINPLEIIDKYSNGALIEETVNQITNEPWRKYIPQLIKNKMIQWRTASIEEVYSTSKLIMESSSGDTRKRLFEYVCDLSELVFVNQDTDEETDYVLSDEAETTIMSLVEMIILPHLEVLDRIKETGGNVKFVNMWTKNFTESLKQEVRDRDHWKCVICENDKDLHVHHKIPRKFGGVHHKNNLVTLCASCHSAIETANVQHAFKKCLANFRKQKNKGQKNIYATKDKTLLKEEVESILDKVLLSLINKDEDELTKKITEVMERLDIIFYE